MTMAYAPNLENRVSILEKAMGRLVCMEELPQRSRPDIRILNEHTVRLDDIEAKMDLRFDGVDRRLNDLGKAVGEILSRLGPSGPSRN